MVNLNQFGIAARNANDPDAPEYLKGYKPANNARPGACGICGGDACKEQQEQPAEAKHTTLQRKTREDF